jgi:hypothetical protein
MPTMASQHRASHGNERKGGTELTALERWQSPKFDPSLLVDLTSEVRCPCPAVGAIFGVSANIPFDVESDPPSPLTHTSDSHTINQVHPQHHL